MEGNFLSRYDNKITTWENLIKTDPQNSDLYEKEMCDYMLNCMPFIEEYMEKVQVSSEIEIDSVFNCKINKGLQKKEIFESYLSEVEGRHELDKPIKISTINCKKCNSTKLFMDHKYSENICSDCGTIDCILTDELTFKEEQETSEKIINYSYKRENHFNEWISQFQAQESTTIPPDVIQQLRNEFKKLKIQKLKEITHAKVRTLLKKLRLNKYYEHVPYIVNSLNGMDPPKMTLHLEERLRMMFKEIQDPFDKHCPDERKNFLSYSYVLYKFCELLSEDKYLQCFPLLKSKEKLYQQDIIWKSICKDLKWEYIPTI